MKHSGMPDKSILHSFPYPVYQLKAVSSEILLAAGGGGASKTGVPNRIDVVKIARPTQIVSRGSANASTPLPPEASIIGGVETDSEAVMHMALSASSSGAAVLFTLEGSTCQEYLFCPAKPTSPPKVASVADLEEQDFKVDSTTPKVDDSSSSEEVIQNGVPCGLVSGQQSVKKRSVAADKGTNSVNKSEHIRATEGTWDCHSLRKVSVSPTAALIERKRLDSCSSTNSQLSASYMDDELNCIASGGPGNAWCAIGTIHGGVAVIDRYIAMESSQLASSLLPSSPSLPTSSPLMPSSSYTFTFGDCDEVEETVFPMKPFYALSDVSAGRCAPVCDLALSGCGFNEGTEEIRLVPLLATISGRPLGSLLRIWRILGPAVTASTASTTATSTTTTNGCLDEANSLLTTSRQRKPKKNVTIVEDPSRTGLSELDNGATGAHCTLEESKMAHLLHAEFRMESFALGTKQKASTARPHLETGTRFRHCEFLRWIHRSAPKQPSDSGDNTSMISTFLVATEQPISPNGKSICCLSVWRIPMLPAGFSPSSPPPISLERFAKVELPPGQLPACLAVNPSRTRGLVALGSMEGSVDVFLVSLRSQSLVKVYSMPTAHPIFVTSLTFLPPREASLEPDEPCPSTGCVAVPHYELVSASADRVLRWHPGPSLRQIAAISNGVRRDGRNSWALAISLLILLTVLPLLLGLADYLLSLLI
ncbi:unnamed protein product [Schistocephalus solidus]|uniref:Protein kinase domain-containing protein n=1 Tax=Schistocephalus solidus TaxID=70667 RepID=A0A183SL38_SCHSO|nr:unnamed protein product [Schistocephalus solidus]